MFKSSVPLKHLITKYVRKHVRNNGELSMQVVPEYSPSDALQRWLNENDHFAYEEVMGEEAFGKWISRLSEDRAKRFIELFGGEYDPNRPKSVRHFWIMSPTFEDAVAARLRFDLGPIIEY